MSELRNTAPGYVVENADPIPDDEDPGIGIGAGDRVSIDDDHESFGGQQGEVKAIARGQGMYEGSIVVDVMLDDMTATERFDSEEVLPA